MKRFFILFYIIILFLFNLFFPLLVYGSDVIDKNFDTRKESNMTADSFEKHFGKGVLSGYGDKVIEVAKRNNVNAAFMAGIMGEETGWGTSAMIREINNPGGLTCKNGSSGEGWTCVGRPRKDGSVRYWKKFDNLDVALEEKAAYLSRKYHDDNKYTIYEIQQIYCPDGDGCSNWIPGVISGMKKMGEEGTGEILEGGAGSYIDMDSIGDDIPSIFSEYYIDIDSTGVNKKTDYNTSYMNYKVGNVVGLLTQWIINLSYVLGFISLGYLSLVWLVSLLAYNGLPPAKKALDFLTMGKIDVNNGFGELFKLSFYLFIFISISLGGFIPVIFSLIYKTFSNFLELVFLL